MIRVASALALLSLLSAQDKSQEYEFKWGLAKEVAADYAVLEVKGGKPVPAKDRFFFIYGSELLDDGTSSLMVNAYDDIGYVFLFILPKGKVKLGARWSYETTLFKDARLALTPQHAFKELLFKGECRFRKIDKVQERECAVIEGIFQYFEIRVDAQGVKTPQRQPMGTLHVVQWLSLTNTELVKGSYELNGKGEEYKGIKQGESPKSSKLSVAGLIELKKDYINLDVKGQVQPIAGAIRQGVAWLRTQQERNGSYIDRGGSFAREFPVGTTALCLMALLHSGVKADDPIVKAGFAYIKGQPFRQTYDVAVTLMLYETKYLPLEQYQEMADLSEEKAKEAIKKAITAEDRAFAEKATKWLLDTQTADGTWGYPDRAESFDHSNTQYALLALKSAARMGISISEAVWKRILTHWVATQRRTGNPIALNIEWFNAEETGIGAVAADEKFAPGPWGYLTRPLAGSMNDVPDKGYGSMTCAGLTSLIIAESELAAKGGLDAKLRADIDKAKKQGLAWLQAHYSIRGAPPAAGFWSVFFMYYLYSLERVGVLYGIRTLGGHDWYLEGAVLLCRTQHGDGKWVSYDEIPVLDTAFALLFLKKATIRVATQRAK